MPGETAPQLKLEEFLQRLALERDFDLRGYKHTTLERRLSKRMRQLSIGSYGDYLEYFRQNQNETGALLDTLLINVTEFFRDPAAWDVIAQEVLPALLKNIRTGDSFRAWVAGCASGEEVYSLAILVAEHFGSRLGEYDIKIYATDVDQDALNVARRGEYPVDRLRRLSPEWKARYFTGAGKLRVARDLRRLIIFGRSDLVHDAPISHLQLLICRNVLIYFDSPTQKHILKNLRYALDPGGVLFLGKSESKLSDSVYFRPVNSRWRIFWRLPFREPEPRNHSESNMVANRPSNSKQEADTLRLYNRALMDSVETAIFALDSQDVVIAENEATQKLWGFSETLIGRNVRETLITARCPEMMARLDESRKPSAPPLNFRCDLPGTGGARSLHVALHPVASEDGNRAGMLIFASDVSQDDKLQATVEQLQSTSEELQSANEELETTNEELQSTNEELETTNEELQSTNEELETTNEELQSLNEELENMNEELELRSRELNNLNQRYAETLERMPWAVTVLDNSGKIQFWNSAAEKLFNLQGSSVIGLQVAQLPLEHSLRQAMLRRMRAVIENRKPSLLRSQQLRTGSSAAEFDVHFTPVNREGASLSVLLIFSPARALKTAARQSSRRRANAKNDSRQNSRPKKKSSTRKNHKRR